METPLLATEGDISAPSLSSGPELIVESEFARLIAQSGNPLQDLSDRFFSQARPPLHPSNLATRGPLVVITAGSLSLLHLGFIWGSYLSDVWSETHLTISIRWQQTLMPILGVLTDTLIRASSLASLLQDLDVSGSYTLMVLLWIVSLILPCAFMILSPSWVLNDLAHPIKMENRVRAFFNSRTLLELTMRFSFLVLFVFLMLNLSTSFIEFHWTDTDVFIQNKIVGGLAAYTFGIASAVTMIVILRSPLPPSSNVRVLRTEVAPAAATPPPVRKPPPSAFRHYYRNAHEDAEDETMPVLEDSPSRRQDIPSEPSTPELIEESDIPTPPSRPPEKIPICYRLIIFQLGLITVALWLPSLYLPIFRFDYSGFAATFMSAPSVKVFLWQLPILVWKHGKQAGTTPLILAVIASILVLTLIALPMLGTCLGVFVWIGEGDWVIKTRQWLYCIQPACTGLVLSTALLSLVHSINPLSNMLLDGSGVCEKFAQALGDDCSIVTASLPRGAWFFLVHSISLEAFVCLTLWYGGVGS